MFATLFADLNIIIIIIIIIILFYYFFHLYVFSRDVGDQSQAPTRPNSRQNLEPRKSIWEIFVAGQQRRFAIDS